MSSRISRRKIAAFVADKLIAGVPAGTAIKEAAAYLIESKRTSERELLVRDIEDILAEKGIVVADVTSAYPLSDALRSEIRSLIGAKELYLRESTDAAVLGGVRIDMPGARFDGTIQRKINALRAQQL
ncbi:F0F1 ATP synthase subunit delta [Streptomyces caniscabiei]|uniref:F0F1 ATP synthase subunit delta n=1 Tax=Streptomyces caniscabiei TaxID=2746961 RepID=UPI0029A0FBBF|nr:F0F1 ATP synthase subunit delta [Streptomyces caniscabiei]MDX2776087.1 F0F1 ATP synthase subunit delta [Streptomyces caniscabiei]